MCGDLHKLVLAARTLPQADLAKPLQEDLAPIGKVLAERRRTQR
ncbi:MAG TPA: hypothetical protein VN253_22400 [Kofleriaceae bacterium]|nr:hypothetical protein [Kofleriaceae bacterium]